MIRTFDFILKAKYNKAFMEQLDAGKRRVSFHKSRRKEKFG